MECAPGPEVEAEPSDNHFKPKKGFKSRKWVLTIWQQFNSKPVWDEKHMRYLIFGDEVTKKGTPHWQTYVYFKNETSFEVVRHTFGSKLYMRSAMGTPQENRAYCSKTGNFEEYGELPSEQGKPKKLDAILEDIKEGLDTGDIIEKHGGTAIMLGRRIDWARDALQSKKKEIPKIRKTFIVWGPPGTGKSTLCRRMFPGLTVHEQDGQSKDWDGYTDQDVVVINEKSPGKAGDWDIAYYKKLCDPEQLFMLKIMFKRIPLKAKYIFITSNHDPQFWWPGEAEVDKAAFNRRVADTFHLDEVYTNN